MKEECQAKSIYFIRHRGRHPLDEANRRLWNIMALAAKDIEAMCDEKGAEWSGEQR